MNGITFDDIPNAVFSLSGYLEREKKILTGETPRQYLEKQIAIMQTIRDALLFVKNYQDLGLRPPSWQNVVHIYLLAESHLNLQGLSRDLNPEGLEIYADPLLEKVFQILVENVLLHAATATGITLRCHLDGEGLVLTFEDNGTGIPADMKERIFTRRCEGKSGMRLYLAREILSTTEITINETGEPGKGAQVEMLVPKGSFRFA